ncbi:MAG: hypothetical protein HQL32_14660 [Planctomycetes bacterium]|nr:hypothetical protein [Planctomycetota bacterium]
MMYKQDHKIIGYIANDSRSKVVMANNRAIIVGGSETELKDFISENFPDLSSQIVLKKTKYGTIHSYLEKGECYAFTKESYERFYPIGIENNLKLPSPSIEEWDQQIAQGNSLITISVEESGS